MTWLPARDAVDQADAGELHDAADVPHLPGGRPASPRPPTCSPRPHGRSVEMFTPSVEPLGDGFTLSMPRPAAAAGGGAPLVSRRRPGPAARFGERGRCLLAPNPGMMTLDGTNTWVLREPGAERAIVVDPGPVEDGHLDLLSRTTGDVGLVLLTHHHFDHSEVAAAFAERKGCAVRALDPDYCLGATRCVDGEEIDVDGLQLRVVTTPGHTADSISFVLPAERALLTGDMVLGPRHHGGRPPRRPARPLLRLDRADAGAGHRRRGRRRIWPGPRPGARRRRRRARLLPRPPPRAPRPGARRPSPRSASPPTPGARPTTTPCRAGWSRSSTPTSTSRSGARRAVGAGPARLPRRAVSSR